VVIAVLQTIKSISNTDGKPLVLIPLVFVTFTVLIKDAYEQFYRYLKDKEENNRETSLLTNEGYNITTVEKLHIGDIVRISKD
jgi:magnesium-transporting ATPase (P-type)